MKKIVLCCTLSVTSSVIAAKMRALVEARDLDIDVKSMPVGEAVDYVENADVIMWSPAVVFAKTAFEEAGAKKVVTITSDAGCSASACGAAPRHGTRRSR